MRYEHINDVEVTAQFSFENDLHYRYHLEIALKDALPTGKAACVVMQNPSYAGEDVADKSVQFMEKIVFKKDLPEFAGVCRLIVVNQFAYIETNNFHGLSHQIGALNDAAIKGALHESDIIILAGVLPIVLKSEKRLFMAFLLRCCRKRYSKPRCIPHEVDTMDLFSHISINCYEY